MSVTEFTVRAEEGRSLNRIGSQIQGLATLRDLDCYLERQSDTELEVTLEAPPTPKELRAVRQRIDDITGVEEVTR